MPQLFLKRADVCFDSSFVSTCHVCLLVDVLLRPFLQRPVWTRKGWILLVLIADPAGHVGEKKKKRLIRTAFSVSVSPPFLFLPLSSLCPPLYSGGKWSKRLQGAVTAKPDEEGVYCSAIKQNKKQKYAVWRRALANSKGEQSRGPELGSVRMCADLHVFHVCMCLYAHCAKTLRYSISIWYNENNTSYYHGDANQNKGM